MALAESRGNPIPRFTFHMTLDARLRHALRLADSELAVILDGFNLLGSGTEILEDLRTGPMWRTSTEMMPGRALLLRLEVALP